MENIKEKAKEFAIKAHENQIRKSNGKKMIYHPIAVAKILEDFNYDDETIAAGYLHDTVEDTKVTIDNIENIFGKKTASLVFNASEPDKSLEWEVRKQHTINLVQNKSLEDVVVVIADKIHNVEDLTNELKKQGLSVFKSFKRGYDQLLWYFEGIYNAINPKYHDNLIVIRLKQAILNLKEEVKIKTVI